MTAEEAVRLVASQVSKLIKGVFQLFFVGVFIAGGYGIGISFIVGAFAQIPMFLVLGNGGEWDVLGVIGLLSCDVDLFAALKIMESCRIADFTGTPLVGLNKIITWVLDTNIAVLAIFAGLFILMPLGIFMHTVLGIDLDGMW